MTRATFRVAMSIYSVLGWWWFRVEGGAALEQQRVDERLGQVSPELALGDVELLGQQPRRAARAAIALEERPRRQVVPLLVERQGQQESTQEERPFGFAERAGVVREAVDVVVVHQLGDHGVDGGDGAGVGGRQCVADARHQQGGIDPRVARGALPPPVGVQAVLRASARMASANPLQRPDWGPGASLAMARSPDTQVRREWAHR